MAPRGGDVLSITLARVRLQRVGGGVAQRGYAAGGIAGRRQKVLEVHPVKFLESLVEHQLHLLGNVIHVRDSGRCDAE